MVQQTRKGISRLQRDILQVLQAVPENLRPNGDAWGHSYIGHLPTTGDIIEALGRSRENKNYAAVSKALMRLEARGLLSSYGSIVRLRGDARRYALSDRGRSDDT